MDRYEYANRDAARKAFQTRQTIEHNLFENDKAQIKLVNPGGNDVNIQKALNSINLLGTFLLITIYFQYFFKRNFMIEKKLYFAVFYSCLHLSFVFI